MGNQLLTADVMRQILKETRQEYADPPEVHFRRHRIDPMTSQYIGPDDWLQVNVYTTVSTTGLSLAWRYLDADGSMHYASESLDGIPTTTLTTRIFRLTEGWLLGVCVSNLGGGLADAACFVSFGLQQGGAAGTPLHTLLAQEFVSNLLTVDWPPVYTRGPATSGLPAGVTPGDLAIYSGTAWVKFAGNTSGNKLLQESSAGVASWVAAASAVFQQVKVNLASADILALKTTAIQLVAAPGANKQITVLALTLAFHPVVTPYTVDATSKIDLLIASGTPTVLAAIPCTGFIDQAAAKYVSTPLAAGSSPFAQDPTGAALTLKLEGTAATLGDGTLTVSVSYVIDTTA